MSKQRSRRGRQDRKRLVESYVKVNGMVCFGLDGISPHPARKLEVDHIKPVALGGTDRDGLRVLCERCNRSSGARLGNQLRGRRSGGADVWPRYSRDW